MNEARGCNQGVREAFCLVAQAIFWRENHELDPRVIYKHAVQHLQLVVGYA